MLCITSFDGLITSECLAYLGDKCLIGRRCSKQVIGGGCKERGRCFATSDSGSKDLDQARQVTTGATAPRDHPFAEQEETIHT